MSISRLKLDFDYIRDLSEQIESSLGLYQGYYSLDADRLPVRRRPQPWHLPDIVFAQGDNEELQCTPLIALFDERSQRGALDASQQARIAEHCEPKRMRITAEGKVLPRQEGVVLVLALDQMDESAIETCLDMKTLVSRGGCIACE